MVEGERQRKSFQHINLTFMPVPPVSIVNPGSRSGADLLPSRWADGRGAST
jgi:hypothetical protein